MSKTSPVEQASDNTRDIFPVVCDDNTKVACKTVAKNSDSFDEENQISPAPL